MDKRPIGVFDSGLGGLSIAKQMKRALPGEQIIYFGDIARVPYGNRSAKTILRYTRECVDFLISQDVKCIIAACGTVSSTVDEAFVESLPVPFTGIVGPTSKAAVAATKTGKIGVVGTATTVRSGSFVRAILKEDPTLDVTARACPLFVPLVENGYIGPGNEVSTLVARDYFSFMPGSDIDTIILGCTHFPLLKSVIGPIVGDHVKLIDPGVHTTQVVKDMLRERDMESGREISDADHYFVSDLTGDFSAVASIFMGDCFNGDVSTVHLPIK